MAEAPLRDYPYAILGASREVMATRRFISTVMYLAHLVT
jgi:hypothetical protein